MASGPASTPTFLPTVTSAGTAVGMILGLGGGAPGELLENVREADWSPDGSQLAIIREAQGKDRLEFPIGRVRVLGLSERRSCFTGR